MKRHLPTALAVAALAAVGLTSPASARDGGVRTFRAPLVEGPVEPLGPIADPYLPRNYVPLDRTQPYTYGLIDAPVARRAATVSRELAQQPTYPHLARVRVATTTILVDPEANYIDRPWGGFDRGLYIARAQRLARSLWNRPVVRTYRNEAPPVVGNVENRPLDRPGVILYSPLPGRELAPEANPAPQAPRREVKPDRQRMARSAD